MEKLKPQEIEKIKNFESALVTWSKKYNLINESGFYTGLALFSIVVSARYVLNDNLYNKDDWFFDKKTDELIFILPMTNRVDIPEIEVPDCTGPRLFGLKRLKPRFALFRKIFS
ncbi:hypothetical protein [Thermoanaerobacterium thermosaccharolyticum]|uniref:hypothetical protein n=1 Tax=Thermoanaerobacterium thermosaccharolyticum TaxID=1517 RepID=UPI003D26F5F9